MNKVGLVTRSGLAVLLLAIGGLMVAAPANAAYPTASETACTVNVAAKASQTHGVIHFRVASGTATVPAGNAVIQVSGYAAKTVALRNGAADVKLPAGIKHLHKYTVTGTFVPTSASFKGCSARDSYDPGAAANTGGGTQGGPTAGLGGLLPNTGGFPQWWLWAALLMVGAGATLIRVGGRTPQAVRIASGNAH